MSKKDQLQGEGDAEAGVHAGHAGKGVARRPRQAPGRMTARPQGADNGVRDEDHSAASSRPDDLDADE